MQKFATIKVNEFFYLTSSKPKFVLPGFPQLQFPTHSLDHGEQVCKKASTVTYINLSEPFMGEVSYSPAIESRIVTMAERQAESAIQDPPAPVPVKKSAAPKKKAAAKKSAPESAVKPAKKSVAKKPILPPDRVANKPVAKKAAKKTAKKR
jgi:hypothetical protein